MNFDYPPKAEPESEKLPESFPGFISRYKTLMQKGLVMTALVLASSFSKAQAVEHAPFGLDKATIGKTEATTKEVAKIDTLFNRVMKTFSYYQTHKGDSSLEKSHEVFSKITALDTKELDKVISYVDTASRTPDEQYIMNMQISKNGVILMEHKGDTTTNYKISTQEKDGQMVPVLSKSIYVGQEEKPRVQTSTGYPQNFDEMNKIFRNLEQAVKPAMAEVNTLQIKKGPELVQN